MYLRIQANPPRRRPPIRRSNPSPPNFSPRFRLVRDTLPSLEEVIKRLLYLSLVCGLIAGWASSQSRIEPQDKAALIAAPNFPYTVYGDGFALAHARQDDAAKARFEDFI